MATKRTSVVLCLVRCGQTAWGPSGGVHGVTDLPLSDTGRTMAIQNAARAGLRHITTFHHPPDEAAADTATIFARTCGAKTKSVADLADPDLGLLEGLTEQQFAERFPRRYKQWDGDLLSLSPPEGEDLIDGRACLFRAVAKIVRRSRSRRIGFVLHDLSLGFLRCWMADRPAPEHSAMVESASPIEHYTMALDMIDLLEAAAETETASS